MWRAFQREERARQRLAPPLLPGLPQRALLPPGAVWTGGAAQPAAAGGGCAAAADGCAPPAAWASVRPRRRR
jgi:hypothetical protein